MIPSPTNNPVDPVRYWPSGLPQSISTISTGLFFYPNTILQKIGGCSPRLKVLAALGAIGVSGANITYHSAIENPVGFNRFMYGFSWWKDRSMAFY